jgi:C4-dicarboxylate-specific signal transduction histidine kinase
MNMMQAYLDIFNLDNLEAVVAAALKMFIGLFQPEAACLLLWDDELRRYVVGETWIGTPGLNVATFQRYALRYLANEEGIDDLEWHCLLLNSSSAVVGAMVYVSDTVFPSSEEDRFAQYIGRAIDTNFRLEIAEREHTQLEEDAQRLEHLLRAVEQQQRTIDRLLTVEREWSAELEKRVSARTAALKAAQQRLIQSEKLAAIGQLASSLAHELNNPLQAIQSGVELMIDELECDNIPQLREDLPIIQEELERIESIFRQMLDFYRPTSQEQVPLDLNEICNGVNVLMRKRLQQSHVTLEVNTTPELPLNCGDRNQIKQILINLILNATEAMEPGGGRICLHTGAALAEGYTYIQVSDNGPGVAAEHMPRLFEPLFTTKTRGLGLGLAISREIAEKHGGSLAVDTQLQHGTTFSLSLPIRKDCHA